MATDGVVLLDEHQYFRSNEATVDSSFIVNREILATTRLLRPVDTMGGLVAERQLKSPSGRHP